MTDKDYIWDKRFVKGNYAYCEDLHTHLPILNTINKFRCQDILDVGCYTGTLAMVLPFNQVNSYHGFDISSLALEKARDKCNGIHQASFELADLETFDSKKKFDTLVFAGIFTYNYSDKIAIDYAKRFDSKYIICQDVVRKRVMYPNLIKTYEVAHKQHYRIKSRPQRDLRQLYVFKVS